MSLNLRDYQVTAIQQMRNGSILCGGVGSGKSRTALAYYYKEQGGQITYPDNREYVPMKYHPQDLYIITTARKRDTNEWEEELVPFHISTKPEYNALYTNKVVVDSWNNIGKYSNVSGAFFIFDEQRVVGNGAWVKSFYAITKKNNWILLSATPGDTWMDYISVFVANGFYRNRTDFIRQHVVYARYSHFPKVEGYLDEDRLEAHREAVVVQMKFDRPTRSHHIYVQTDYDKALYRKTMKTRMDPYKKEPINDAGALCYVLRRICNSDTKRLDRTMELLKERKRAIIFYNFDYELEMLRGALSEKELLYAEWNGHKHESVPEGDSWAYLVQYTAGAEGWNCVSTDTIIFYSQNYSYKIMVQAAGRIDRMNTKFVDLYYYHMSSVSSIDFAIKAAIDRKENFNEKLFVAS